MNKYKKEKYMIYLIIKTIIRNNLKIKKITLYSFKLFNYLKKIKF